MTHAEPRAESGTADPAPGGSWAWGENGFGQLGNQTADWRGPHTIPSRVVGLNDVTLIAAGGSHSLAATADRGLWAWGDNTYGQLGDGTTAARRMPVRVPGLGQVAALAAGDRHSLALLPDGSVWAWGDNAAGQLGIDSLNGHLSPLPIPGLGDVRAIAAGRLQSLALASDGTVWTWGAYVPVQYTRLSASQATTRRVPHRLDGLAGVAGIAAGDRHGLAMKSDGTVWAWGDNASGQLGDGTTADSGLPVRVSRLGAVVAVAAGAEHSLALRADGSVWAWGADMVGQLGDGQHAQSAMPVRVRGLDGVVAIAASASHSVALRGDGTVWTWGAVADSPHAASAPFALDTVPVPVGGLTGVSGIAAGATHALAFTAPPFFARHESADGSIRYAGRWTEREIAGASGGSTHVAEAGEPGEASLQWVGTDLAVLMPTGPEMGMAWLIVDEADAHLVDLYSPQLRPQQPVLVLSGLPRGPHLVTIAPSQQKNAYSSDHTIALDAIDVR